MGRVGFRVLRLQPAISLKANRYTGMRVTFDVPTPSAFFKKSVLRQLYVCEIFTNFYLYRLWALITKGQCCLMGHPRRHFDQYTIASITCIVHGATLCTTDF